MAGGRKNKKKVKNKELRDRNLDQGQAQSTHEGTAGSGLEPGTSKTGDFPDNSGSENRMESVLLSTKSLEASEEEQDSKQSSANLTGYEQFPRNETDDDRDPDTSNGSDDFWEAHFERFPLTGPFASQVITQVDGGNTTDEPEPDEPNRYESNRWINQRKPEPVRNQSRIGNGTS